MSWTKAEEVEKKKQSLEEISSFINRKIPSLGSICDANNKEDGN